MRNNFKNNFPYASFLFLDPLTIHYKTLSNFAFQIQPFVFISNFNIILEISPVHLNILISSTYVYENCRLKTIDSIYNF